MNIDVNVDAAAVNKMVTDAILESSIGKTLREVVEKKVSSHSRQFITEFTMQTIDEMDREIASGQTHCYTCGNRLGVVKFECPICREWQCSDECRKKHIETMDAI